MNTPIITVSAPPGVFIAGSGIMPMRGRGYPYIVTGPHEHYLELLAAVDTSPPRRIAVWRDTYAPHTYVAYQQDVLNATREAFSLVTHPLFPGGS